ncbi:uncharacterized protein LOC119167191 isoform X1 [Rhipicephalus microplus]|uniref:uncharacterized protein LOC119167191 isoform X1 n=1 Tax=Rhipicephalus microplus TaxID=6941 RepID=UPI003F6BF3FF
MSEPPDRQKVIEKYLQGLRHDDGYSHGYLKSDEELKLFERSLAAVNESQCRLLHDPLRISNLSGQCAIPSYQGNRQSVHIWNGVLQENSGEKKEQSSSTPDWQKEMYEKKRVNLQGTKKKGCAATMNLKWIELYPDFQVCNVQ